jgi:hypothetical protein
MASRSWWIGAVAAMTVAAAPTAAQAQSQCGSAGYTYSLGLGGALTGCFTGVLSQLGEDAGFISDQYYWAGNFTGVSGVTNAPTTAGTFMFDNDCGSAGGGTFSFCTGAFTKATATVVNNSGEMVLGLRVPDNANGAGLNWVYSGSSVRNSTPMPMGFQAVLLQLTLGGVDQAGQFLFGWEDLNSGCLARAGLNNNRFRMEDLGNAGILDDRLDDCTTILPGGNSDNDFNDSYMRFFIEGTGTPVEDNVVPEPFTMTLMAIGLVGMGGASAVKRRKK